MAQDMNVVTLVGRLTRDSEIKYLQSGTSVTRFSIAVNREKRSNGQREDEVSYFDIVLWGKFGEAIQKYLVRGTQVVVNGELRQNRYEVEGQARSRVEIVANNVQLLGNANTNQTTNRTGNFEQRQRPVQNQNIQTSNTASSIDMDEIGPEAFDDDIPF